MNPELKRFLKEKKEQMPPNWEKETQAQELGMWALEAGYGELPVLNVFGITDGVDQKKFDRAVEEAYSYLVGEARRVLE